MKRLFVCLTLGALALPLLAADSAPADRIVVPFSDPSRPGSVKVNLINGGIAVKAYDGKEVIVEVRAQGQESGRERVNREGLRRIPMTSSGLRVEEENNVMSISVPPSRHADISVQVPLRTSLKLRAINEGDISVEGIQGDVEANNTNGSVTLTKISGSAVAHALNGRLIATFVQVDAQKAMSFSSLNGDIDVTFPSNLKATVKLKSDRGDVFSDFDVVTQASAPPVVEDSRSQKGKYRVRLDQTLQGTINGGGTEIQFSNFNGSIYIRKAK